MGLLSKNEIENQIGILSQELLEMKARLIHIEEKSDGILRNIQDTRNDLWSQNVYKKATPSPAIEVHIVSHCNLNCRMCSHFSPLAEADYLEPEEFERDCQRLYELFQNDLFHLRLLGGEPLLHPKVTAFFEISRRIFPYTNLELLTNGILLTKMEEGFWHSCRENGIKIIVTKYPIQLNFGEIEQKAKNMGVFLSYTRDDNQNFDSDTTVKEMHHCPLDLEGGQQINRNFQLCFHSNGCVQLVHGRLFTCPVAAYAPDFNTYFNKELVCSDRDSIDLYQAQTANEVCEFLSRPIPFCRYCNIEKRSFGHAFGISKKEIGEWIIDNP